MGRKHCGIRRNCSLRAIFPFPSVFKRLVSQGRQKVSLCGNGLILCHTIRTFKTLKQTFENIVGKGENARNQHFLLFPQCFQPYQTHKKKKQFSYFYLVVCKCFQFANAIISLSGEELTLYHTIPSFNDSQKEFF